MVADVAGPDGRLAVVTTHPSFLRPWNSLQLRRLTAALPQRLSQPTVVLGDLNMGPGPAGRGTGMRALASGRTFPATAPRVQIDHILASGIGPARGRVVQLPVSDHRAVVADL